MTYDKWLLNTIMILTAATLLALSPTFFTTLSNFFVYSKLGQVSLRKKTICLSNCAWWHSDTAAIKPFMPTQDSPICAIHTISQLLTPSLISTLSSLKNSPKSVQHVNIYSFVEENASFNIITIFMPIMTIIIMFFVNFVTRSLLVALEGTSAVSSTLISLLRHN